MWKQWWQREDGEDYGEEGDKEDEKQDRDDEDEEDVKVVATDHDHDPLPFHFPGGHPSPRGAHLPTGQVENDYFFRLLLFFLGFHSFSLCIFGVENMTE